MLAINAAIFTAETQFTGRVNVLAINAAIFTAEYAELRRDNQNQGETAVPLNAAKAASRSFVPLQAELTKDAKPLRGSFSSPDLSLSREGFLRALCVLSGEDSRLYRNCSFPKVTVFIGVLYALCVSNHRVLRAIAALFQACDKLVHRDSRHGHHAHRPPGSDLY